MSRLLALILLVLLAFSAPAAAAQTSCPGGAAAPGLGLVREGYDVLTVLFVEPLPSDTLLRAAANGVETELKRTAPTAPAPPALALGGDASDNWARFVDHYCLVWEARPPGLPAEAVAHAAIRAMALSADEEHTRFLAPAMFQEHLAWAAGNQRYQGIGARLRANPLTIQDVFQASPAQEAGLAPGDRIVAINGQPAADLPAIDAVMLIRGEAGTAVRISISRATLPEPVELVIVRASVQIPSVEARTIDGYGYLRIFDFPNRSTFERVAAELESFRSAEAEGLVLDLRGNSGGRLDVGTNVAGLFLPEGAPLYRETTRLGRTTTRVASAGAVWVRPLVVLVDDGTASMGEILAAALQEQGLGPLVGERTAGAVAGGRLVPLSDGSALQVTALRIDSGLGTVLNRVGVTPDVEVRPIDPIPPADQVLDAALAYLRGLGTPSEARGPTAPAEIDRRLEILPVAA